MDFFFNYADIAVQVEPIRAALSAATAALIAAGIGAAGSLGAAGISANASKNANASAQGVLDDQQAKNQLWWEQKQNENFLDTAEAQAAITKAGELAKEQMTAARGRQAVMGGTDASIAATQQSANKMLSDTVSGLAATGTARKDAFEQQYLAQNNALAQQLIATYQNKAAQSAAAGSSALGVFGGIGSSLITALGGSEK